MTDRDKARDLIMGAMTKQKNAEEIFEESGSSFVPKTKIAMTQSFKNKIFSALEANGYNVRNANVAAAVSMFFTNLENI